MKWNRDRCQGAEAFPAARLRPPGTWGLQGCNQYQPNYLQSLWDSRKVWRSHVLRCFTDEFINKLRWDLTKRLRGSCGAESGRGLLRIPRMPRGRGDKIISRDPKWAVLWRCWKKPFSGAAANSVQVQIIHLNRLWEERETLMSDQVGMKRRWSLFIAHTAALFVEAHTKCTVSHFESLLFASWCSPVSEFKMAALCTSVVFCGSATVPALLVLSSWLCCPCGRRSSVNANALCWSACRAAESWYTIWGHTGEIQWSVVVDHRTGCV